MPHHHAVVSDRKVAALRQAMGPVIAGALADRLVVEVMVNPDGKIWIDRIGEGRSWTGEFLPPADADRIVRHRRPVGGQHQHRCRRDRDRRRCLSGRHIGGDWDRLRQ